MRKPPLIATALMLIGVSILCTLGTWQLQRLEWKQDIINRLEAAYDGQAPKALNLSTTPQEYSYGYVEGVFQPQKSILIGPRTKDKKIGNDLIVPLKVDGKTLFINMGWSDWPLDEMPIYHLKNKRVRFEGLVVKPSWNSFTPENIPSEGTWYKLDLNEITKAQDLAEPYPFIIRAEHANHKFDAAFPNNERLYPNNKHMQYAMFWFSMAAVLIIIFGLRFLRKET